jgi:hypothetical protein
MAEPPRKKQRSTDSAGSSNVPLLPDAPFRFLDLPGGNVTENVAIRISLTLRPEIRNRVYRFAREDESTPILIKRPHTIRDGFPDEKHGSRQYLSLTQVSHRIRNEFRPIYHEQTNVNVQICDLADYLQDVLEVGHIEDKSVAGNISAELVASDAPFAISVMRLLNLSASSVRLRLSFLPKGFCGCTSFSEFFYEMFRACFAQLFNEMLRTEKDALVLERSGSPVSEIALIGHVSGWQCFAVYLFVKKSAWEEWMDYWNDEAAHAYSPGGRDMIERGKVWARSIGLSLGNDDTIISVLRFQKVYADSEQGEELQVGSLKFEGLFLKQIEAVYEDS